MSHPITLLEKPNLIIKGYRYQVNNPAPDESLDCIELDFCIQINGSLKNFTNSFIIGSHIEGDDSSDNGSTASVGVENDGEWFLIVRMLNTFGYGISEDVKSSRSLLERWIEQIKYHRED